MEEDKKSIKQLHSLIFPVYNEEGNLLEYMIRLQR